MTAEKSLPFLILSFSSSVKGTQAVPYDQQLQSRLHPTKMSTFVHPDILSRKFTAPLLTVKSINSAHHTMEYYSDESDNRNVSHKIMLSEKKQTQRTYTLSFSLWKVHRDCWCEVHVIG